MALAYATDLATGHSRDFALRSCVLAMRFADVLARPCAARLSSGAAALHRLQCRYAFAGGALGDEIALHRELHHIDLGNSTEFVEVLVRALTRKFAEHRRKSWQRP